jgi:hypothetical protein
MNRTPITSAAGPPASGMSTRGRDREGRRQQLDEQPAQARAADEGESAARVDERLALHVPVAGHQRDEDGRVADCEQHAQRAHAEGHPVQLPQGQHVQAGAGREPISQR